MKQLNVDIAKGGAKAGFGMTPKAASALQYARLAFRLFLFAAAVLIYIFEKITEISPKYRLVLIITVWTVYMAEMILRFFPTSIVNIGRQKQFKRFYSKRDAVPAEINALRKKNNRDVVVTAAAWIAMNAVFAVLFFTKVFDGWIMLLISLLYSIGDMVCILFYCPFQSLIMKNRCCVNCRIYNWDYAMMFTPLACVSGFFSLSLCIAAFALLAKWEFAYALHPERFSELTNGCLDCADCKSKLCGHRKRFMKLFRSRKRP